MRIITRNIEYPLLLSDAGAGFGIAVEAHKRQARFRVGGQRSPIYIGSRFEVEKAKGFLQGA